MATVQIHQLCHNHILFKGKNWNASHDLHRNCISFSKFGLNSKSKSEFSNFSNCRKAKTTFTVRAESSGSISEESIEEIPSLLPDANFYKVEAIIRPWRLKFVASALLKNGILGVTVSEVKGFGAQGGSRERYAGSEFEDDKLVLKTKIEVIVIKDQVDIVVNIIIDEARTGEIGDGKIFILPVADVVRVRTGERGFDAERMVGGLLEKSNQDAKI